MGRVEQSLPGFVKFAGEGMGDGVKDFGRGKNYNRRNQKCHFALQYALPEYV